MNEFHSFMFQDIAHLIEAEDSEVTQQQPLSETPLKIKLCLRPRKSEAYSKLEETSPSPDIIKGDKRPEILLSCKSCKNKGDENKSSDKTQQKKSSIQDRTFSDLPENVCDDIETTFEDLDESVCKSLPTDTFDDIPQNTFDDIEVAIEENETN